MNVQRAKAFFIDFTIVFELLAERLTNAEEINQMKEYFIGEYPEIFDNPFDFNVMETEAERIVNDEKKLGDIQEKFLHRGSAERLMTNYEGINDDKNLMMVQNINMYQRAIDDTTGRKIYYASMQGRLLDICVTQRKDIYQRMLNKTGIERQWANFLRRLYQFVNVYNQLSYCMVSVSYICRNFKSIEVICKRHPES